MSTQPILPNDGINDDIDDKQSLIENSDKFKEKIKTISDSIMEQNKELNKIYKDLKDSQIDVYKKIDIYNNCECKKKCCKKYCCSYCFYLNCKYWIRCRWDNNNDDERLQLISKKSKEIENLNNRKDELNNNKENNKIDFCFITCLYIFSLFHYFSLSAIGLISSAILKEIYRSIKRSFIGHYDDYNNIQTFYYFLTDSNFHDSSQINFNYMFSFLSLYVINLFKNGSNLETAKVYLISVLLIFLLFLSFLYHDYLDEEDMKKEKDDNYGILELIFYFIIPYIFIYLFAGFISLLPHKILNEYIKNNNITEIENIICLRVCINVIMGISVVLKNLCDYKLVELLECNTITKLLVLEIFLFIIPSIICILYLFKKLFKECFYYCCCKKKEQNVNLNNENNNNIDNNDSEINYLAGNIFVKTKTIYSFITVKGLNKYIISILTDTKIIFILFINLCLRMQKLKFKTDYNNTTKDKALLILNFLITFILYFFINIIFDCCCSNKEDNDNKNKNNKLFEKFILIFILVDSLIVLIISIIFFRMKECEPITVYISIILTGSINFFLYDYYSLQEVEYISLSGIVSLAHLIFRLVDRYCSSFKSYLLQIIFSGCGIILILFYLNKFLNKELKCCICI